MQKLHYKIGINATAEAVFDAILGLSNKETYTHWTSEFGSGSTYEGSWKEGTKIYFLATDKEGNREGMVSEIAALEPSKFVSIRHYGIFKGEEEITEGPKVEAWAGGLENYSFSEKDGITTVFIEIDVTEEHKNYFDETWPKALIKLKEIVESAI